MTCTPCVSREEEESAAADERVGGGVVGEKQNRNGVLKKC